MLFQTVLKQLYNSCSVFMQNARLVCRAMHTYAHYYHTPLGMYITKYASQVHTRLSGADPDTKAEEDGTKNNQ